MKSERPWAALVRTFPMLCTRCAALVGCWMIHHRTNATAAHVRTVLSFTAASLGAQTSPFCQYPFILARNRPGCGSKPARSSPYSVPNGCSMPRTSRRYACLVESMPRRGAVCSRRRPAGSSHAGERAPTCWPARSAVIFAAGHRCIRTFRFLDVPRSDNIPPCRACLGHGDA
jgi:hypothetical protein